MSNWKMKGRVQSPQAKLSMKHQDKSRVKTRVDLSYNGSSQTLRQDADCGMVQPKSSENHERRTIKGKSKKNDELVKYMSDVPGYLQRVETGENFPEKKVLNVGVLDWSRLEKWNHSQEIVPARVCKNASSSSCNSSQKTLSLSGSDRCKSQAQRVKLSPRATGLDRRITSETGNSNSSPNFPCRLEKSIRVPDGRARRKSGLPTGRIKRNDSDEVTSNLRVFSSKLRSNGTSLGTEEKISAKKADIKMRVLEFQESAIDLGNHHCPDEPKNIVLILPKKYYQNKVSENKTFTDGESKGADPSKFWSSGVPQSRVETTSEPDMLLQTQINVQSTELPSGVSEESPSPITMPSMLSDCKYAANSKLHGKRMDSDFIESPKVLDQETNERADREYRSHTPNRRFSFSLGRMGRSSSLKEDPSVPHLSSPSLIAKSGPVSFEASASHCPENKEKHNLHNRARSSPLRRLLDPFLKQKPAASLHSAETVPPPKVNLNSSSSKAVAVSTVQAFLQLTVKNGLPLFRFVADNNNHVLAATMRNFTTPEKDDSSENFTFYSVDEIKKRSGGWMNQGSKEKKSEYVYNVVGQMRVSTHHSSSLIDPNHNQSVIRESVLFGLEPQLEDQDSAKSTIHRELAAVVINIPTSNDHVKECSFNWPVTQDSAGTVAILPGGLHSFPEKGQPSPLIHRWRSGGSCDCGGWDIGCKLRILSNHDQYNKLSRTSITCPIQDRFELFAQEGTKQDRPIFSLAPIKNGVFSIAFSASISLLQAFFISVAVLNSQKFPDPVKDVPQEDVPARYVPNPPLSPVGRV